MPSHNVLLGPVSEPYDTRKHSELPQVAAILDDFSHQSFNNSANIWRVFPETAGADLKEIHPDFLLVESAWAGNFEKWKYKVTHKAQPSRELVALVERAKQLSIPTVFWNKEDPPHFTDFVSTAGMFEHIFTTEEAVIPKYLAQTDAKSVDLLRFAANPVIHNPRRVEGYREGDICFAGMYFSHKYPERREQMLTLFPPAIDFNFEIYSRHAGGDTRYQFPQPFNDLVVGKLPYSKMVEAYRKYKVFLNVNSVPNSQSMCARRVYELSAAKTAVVGMDSNAIRSIYDESEVLLARSPGEVREIYELLIENEVARRRITQRAWRKTLSAHTYNHRMGQIVEAVGGAKPQSKVRILVVVPNNRASSRVLDEIHRQMFTVDADVELEIVKWDREEGNEVDFDRLKLADFHVAFVDGNYKIGRFYLNDLLLTLRQQDANFVCKSPGWTRGFEGYEEDFSQELPTYGWLARQGEILCAQDLRDALTEDTKDRRVYWTDPCGIAPRDGSSNELLEA